MGCGGDTWVSWGWCKCLKKPLCNRTGKGSEIPPLHPTPPPALDFVCVCLIKFKLFLLKCHLRIDWLCCEAICLYSATSGVYFDNCEEIIFYLQDLFHTKDLQKNKQKSITPVFYHLRHILHLNVGCFCVFTDRRHWFLPLVLLGAH